MVQVIEASEQCERLTIPQLSKQPIDFDDLIDQMTTTAAAPSNAVVHNNNNGNKDDDSPTLWLICRERQPSSKSILKTLEDQKTRYKSINICVGPEGGWSQKEVKKFEQLVNTQQQEQEDNVKFVSLGPLVLRAETAAISAIAAVMMSFDS